MAASTGQAQTSKAEGAEKRPKKSMPTGHSNKAVSKPDLVFRGEQAPSGKSPLAKTKARKPKFSNNIKKNGKNDKGEVIVRKEGGVVDKQQGIAVGASGKADKQIAKVLATPHWYDIALPSLDPNTKASAITEDFVASQFSRAAGLLEKETAAFVASTSGGSTALGMSAADANFLSRVLSSGTLSDRLSALTLMVQASPLHNTRALDTLKGMASKKSRDESMKAIRSITDWWVGGGVPSRKLKYFRDHPLTHPTVTELHLILWYFEDWLKKYFFSILQSLEALSLDPLPYVRTQAISQIAQLLSDKPEQEQNLLRLLVNKLGDPERTVASKASFHLLQILQSHPAMKAVVIREVSALILRVPSSSAGPKPENHHARYYGLITFNQTTLTAADKDIARHLVDVYFDLFRELLGHQAAKGTGEPTKSDAQADGNKGEKERRKGKDKKGKADKGKGKATEFAEDEEENSKMIAAILTGVNRALPFAKLEQSSLDNHIDMLFRITHSATFNISVQALVLVQHIITDNKTISDRFYRTLYESLFDPRLINSSKQAIYLNLLFRAMKADSNVDRVMAFIKRITQTLTLHQPPFICGAIYLLGQLKDTIPSITQLFNGAEANPAPVDAETSAGTYDARKRDPQHAHAATSRLWEITPFFNHFHPSVSLHARQFVEGTQITATADLGLNTVMHFLDRFVYRNPKKPRQKGASAMQPAAASDGDKGMVKLTKGAAASMSDTNPNDQSFWSRSVADVPADQLFFHKYFAQKLGQEKARTDKANKRKRKGDPDQQQEFAGFSDEESADEEESAKAAVDEENGEGSDIDEDEIWKAMKESMPVAEGDMDLMEDDDPVDIDDDEDDLDAMESLAGDVSSVEEEADGVELEPASDEDNDAPEFDEEAEDDLVDLEAEVPDVFVSDEEVRSGKRKAEEGPPRGKRRKLRQLPTFATYEDYAALIEAEPDDDI